ncbi:uncharacterized protein LOC129725197 [Wyeomyia smithii]|uniref:uncharacterized protein LOC129725197 n=1 Tax=Wyeomyia smithii TaxID=174621 RepID=UPI002467E860|nr:uncharacterized protein LOC129725197 [Wyeomyia smithii]
MMDISNQNEDIIENGKLKRKKIKPSDKETNKKPKIAYSTNSANKLIQNIHAQLKEECVAADVIRHFARSLQDNPAYAVDYIRAGGTFTHFIKILKSMDIGKLADVADLYTVIHYVMIECSNYDEVHAAYASKCAKTILSDFKSSIVSLLNVQSTEPLLMAGFRILKAILLIDPSHGKEILHLLDVCLPQLDLKRYREVSSDEQAASLRGVFVDFNLSFLIDSSADLVRSWLNRYHLIYPLVCNLIYDRAENVVLVMKTFQQYVLENSSIDKFVYRTTFTVDILKALVNTYDWVGPPKVMVSDESKNMVVNATEKVVLPLLTSKKYHLVPKIIDLGRGITRHKHILLALKSSKLEKQHRKLILRIFDVCPEALPAVLENYGSLMKSKRNEHFNLLLEILRQPKPEEIVKHFDTADAKQVSNFITKSTLPRTILEFVTTSINKKTDVSYCMEFLAVMLSQCEKYLREVPKLKNLDQFDIKKIKFDVINQILALFPTIDAIMSAMMHHRTDKNAVKPYIAMEHTMDILLACIRTFPSYIESSSFITAYRKILDPVYRNVAIEHEYLMYEFKAIKVIIALEPQSIAFNSDLFPSVIKLLTKVYLNGSAEMQREATVQLMSLFRNTALFGNSPSEIEIWFQSLRHVNPAKVPRLVSYLAFSFRQAAERQNITTEKDHSVVNKAFEKSRVANLDELFERVETDACEELDKEDEPVELPVADNFLIYMFHPSTKRPEEFHPYLEAVALRYFHLLPYPEIVENCAESIGGQMHKYFTKWIIDGKVKPLDGFGEQSSLGRLSRLLLKKQQALEDVLPDGHTNRCELTYLIHEVIFYVTQLIELEKFDTDYSTVCLYYLNQFFELLLKEEEELAEKDQKLGGILKNIFCHRPVLYQHFTVMNSKEDMSALVTNFICELMQRLRTVPNFSKHTTLYSNKIVHEIISVSSYENTPKSKQLNTILVEKMHNIFQLSMRNSVNLSKHYAQLSHTIFINDQNEKTCHLSLLTAALEKLASNRECCLESATINGLSRIYVDFIRKNGNELNLETLELALTNYLDVFSHNISHLEEDMFKCLFESKRVGKPLIKLAVFLLERSNRFDMMCLQLVPVHIQKKELIYPLVNIAIRKNLFETNNQDHQKLLTVIYNEFKSGINKTIEKPSKAAVIYKENSTANLKLIKMCMPRNECIDFAKKKLKVDSLENYQLDLLMEIYTKAFAATQNDAVQVQTLYTSVFNVLLQCYHVLLKASDLFKDIEKLNRLTLATYYWVKLSHKCKHLITMDYMHLTNTANWSNFCKYSLKLGIDIHKSPDNPNRYDERLHVLLKIAAIMSDLFYRDNCSAPEVAEFYDLALSHSRFLDVLLIPFQFKVKSALVHLLLTLAHKNRSVMDKKHIPLLLGAYGATLTEGNRYVLALIQLYERCGIHLHEYRPFLWGDAAIKHFSLGQETTKQRTLCQTNNTEVLSLFNREKLINTLNSFPIWRKLDAVEQVPEVNFDYLQKDKHCIGNYRPVMDIEQIVEKGKNRFRKIPGSLLTTCSAKQEVLATIYDPAFLLPLLGYLFAPESDDVLPLAGRCGALALPFACLASTDEQMRLAAGCVVKRIKSYLELSKKFVDSMFWLRMIAAVQNGLATFNSPSNPDKQKRQKASTSELFKPAFLPCLFIGSTVNILPDVLSELHSILTHYFLLKDTFDFKAVPNFLVLFHSADIKHNSHRLFILETINKSIKTHDDFMILRASPVIRALMQFYACALSNRDLNILILNTLNNIIKIPKSCEVMINWIGFLTWLSERIESIESFHFDTIEAFLGIISNMWYSVQIQREHYRMKELSRKFAILVLKFLPLLSTRSSGKTLTRFLNILEKTIGENADNIKLISKEVLEVMLSYFEKLFDQQFWHVQHIRLNGNENCERSQALGEKMLAQGVDECTIYVILTLRRIVIKWQNSCK